MSETLEPALPDQLDKKAEQLMRSHAEIAIGITGFAGPAGPGEEEDLVHVALAKREARTLDHEMHFGAIGRGEVRVQSPKAMLDMLEQSIEQA